jgi:hypothetical protein
MLNILSYLQLLFAQILQIDWLQDYIFNEAFKHESLKEELYLNSS